MTTYLCSYITQAKENQSVRNFTFVCFMKCYYGHLTNGCRLGRLT
jgi:hypothetical protein